MTTTDALLQRVQALEAEHPCWGSRRIGASLRFVESWPVHQKRGLRLMRETSPRGPAQQASQGQADAGGGQPRATKPNEWWGIDMTMLVVGDFGWVSIVVVLDWSSQEDCR